MLLANLCAARATTRSEPVELVLTTTRFFEGRAKNLVLTVGDEQSTTCRQGSGDLSSVHVVFSRKAFNRLRRRARVSADYGTGSTLAWDFGALDKHELAR